MASKPTLPLTPGRVAEGSSLGRADLLRRLGRLSLGAEALPRVLRAVEEEVARALEAHAADSYSASEIVEAGGDDALVDALRERRAERERVAAIRAAGLADLRAEELQAILRDARDRS